MNIAYFINDIHQVGGAEIATQRLAQEVAKHGHKVRIFTSQAVTRWRKHLRLIDYTKDTKVIYLPAWQRTPNTFSYMLAAQALWAFPIFTHNVDILHIRGVTLEAVLLARVARTLNIKTLCVPMASGSYGDLVRFPQNKVKQAINAFDQLSALTEPLREQLISFGFSPKRIAIIPNGVDTEMFCPGESNPTEKSAIFVGQFRPEKRVDLLLEAWQIVQQNNPDASLTLVGGGSNMEIYHQLASSLSIQVKFVPITDTSEVISHLRRNKIFIQPGISEGMSNALLEAMAVGLAPVVSDTSANRSVIQHGSNGLCYSPTSSQDLADKIETLLKNEALQQELATAAQKTMATNFTLNAVNGQYLALYRRMLGEN